MERIRALSVDEFKDRTIDFLDWVNKHRAQITGEEKRKLVEGLEIFLRLERIQDQIAIFKTLLVNIIQYLRPKRGEAVVEPSRVGFVEEFLVALTKYQDTVSRFHPKELSGVQERSFRETKDLIRSQLRILAGNAVEESEDIRE